MTNYGIEIRPDTGEFVILKRVPLTNSFLPVDYFSHAQDFIDFAQVINDALKKYSQNKPVNVCKEFIEGMNLSGF